MRSRFAEGFKLAQECFGVLQADRSLLLFPLIAWPAGLLAVLVALVPMSIALEALHEPDWFLVPYVASILYALIFTSVFFSTALVGAAWRSLDGRDTSVREGLAIAWRRRWLVARWAFIQLIVGALIRALEIVTAEVLGKAAARFVGDVAEEAWAVATFFVVPAIAIDGLGPRDAAARSRETLKRCWGESLAGRASVGFVVFVLSIVPLALFGAWSYALLPYSRPAGIALLGVAAALWFASTVLSSTLAGVFRAAAYRYASSGEVPAALDEDSLREAFVRRPPSRWRRLLGFAR